MVYRKPVLLGVAAGFLGLVVNLFPVPIFTGGMFYFGGVAYLCAGIVLGPVYGVIAAAIASAPLVQDWMHPWAFLMFMLEALIVSWAVRRHSIGIVAADFG